jgi:heme-degrading monooxygenase HmoA
LPPAAAKVFGEGTETTEKEEYAMHVQIITFGLNGISEEDYTKMAEAVAPAIAAMPGLVSKAWLADPETNTYGGAYIWQDCEAMKAYAETDIHKAMATNPHFEGVTMKNFAVLENPTHVTGGALAGVA